MLKTMMITLLWAAVSMSGHLPTDAVDLDGSRILLADRWTHADGHVEIGTILFNDAICFETRVYPGSDGFAKIEGPTVCHGAPEMDQVEAAIERSFNLSAPTASTSLP